MTVFDPIDRFFNVYHTRTRGSIVGRMRHFLILIFKSCINYKTEYLNVELSRTTQNLYLFENMKTHRWAQQARQALQALQALQAAQHGLIVKCKLNGLI